MRGDGNSSAILSGYAGEEKQTYSYQVNFSPEEKNSFIPRLWATKRIGYLVDQIRLYGQSEELIDEIVHLSKRYGIITQYTSFLVDADRPITVTPEKPIIEKGVTANLRTVTGSGAVYQSKSLLGLQGALKAPEAYIDQSGKEKKISRHSQTGNKIFFKKDSLWVDSQYDSSFKTIKYRDSAQPISS